MHTESRVEIRVTQRYGATPERIFGAWLDPQLTGKWLFATASRPMARTAIDARVAGSFCFVDREEGVDVEYTGEYLEITRPRRLVFTLSAPSLSHATTRVLVKISPLGKHGAHQVRRSRNLPDGCELALAHQYVPPDHASRVEARWTGVLYGLGQILSVDCAPRRTTTG